MKTWDSRDVNCTAVSTPTPANNRGVDGVLSAWNVPADATEISDILIVAASNMATAGESGLLFRLSGGGLLDGPEVIAGPGSGGSVATGNERETPPMRLKWAEGKGIRVKPGNQIIAEAEMLQNDTGEVAAAISIAFRVPEGG